MLPRGYTRVEWIGCDGAQYIDTGLKMTGNSSVRIKFKMQNVASDNSPIYPIYGAATNYDSNAFELWGVSNGFATYGSQSFKSQFGMTAGIEQEAFQDKNVLNFEGQTVTFTKQTFTTPVNLLLFATNRNGTIYRCEAGAGLVIMQAQIYDNGTLVRDYIPCQTDTGEVGLYDMATATFYGNDGTGEFLAGGVIVGEDVPDVPEALEYTLAGNIVALTWSASSGAEKYRVYRDYRVIAETESTEHIDTITDAPAAHVYAVTAINEFGESDFSEIVRAEYWGDAAPELIYDRTQADVNDAKALISKYMRGETLDGYEQGLWDKGLRGCYNTSDTNRVEYHTRELQSILNTNGYNIHIDTRLWAKSDIMRYSDIVRYLGNIKTILDAFGRSANAPELPSIDVWIDYVVANDIEKILYVTRELVYGALAMFRRAGTFRAGGDYLAQVIRRA